MLPCARGAAPGVPGGRLVASALLLSLAACSASASGAGPQVSPAAGAAVPVAAALAESDTVERTVEVVGTLCADEDVTLSAKVPGRVREVLADVGDVVSGGGVLAVADAEESRRAETIARRTLEGVLARLGADRAPDERFDVDATALVARARAQLENARARLSRLRDLAGEGEGFVAEQDLRDVETAVVTAGAELEVERTGARALVAEAGLRSEEVALARLRCEDATVRAPGKRAWSVAARFVSEGELVGPGAPLFRVVATDRLKLRATADERDTPLLRAGLAARVTVAAFGDRAFEGAVARVSPTVDPQTRAFGVEVLVANPSNELRAGSFASAAVIVRTEEATFVPFEALVSFAGTERVFLVDGDRARERVVATGERRGGLLEVRGVRPGDSVVTRGHAALVDGALLRLARADELACERAP